MNTTSKHLRLTQAGYENYTGLIGMYPFTDGLSDELITMSERDRIAAAMTCNEVDEDGTELEAGFAARSLREYSARAEVEIFGRITDVEKAAEDAAAALDGEKVKPLYTKEALEELASAEGIAGVRKVAVDWDVRSKSIVELIAMIIKAQSDYVTNRVDELVRKGQSKEDAKALFVYTDVPPLEVPAQIELPADAPADAPAEAPAEPVIDETPGVVEAAASGDLGAALTEE